MEKLGLGTKSTRHEIVQKLFDRSYLQGNQIRPTASGRAVVIALEDNAELIVRPEMTSKLEDDMSEIAEGRKTKEEVVLESQEMLSKCLDILMGHRDQIKAEVLEALNSQNQMGICPKCGEGKLVVRRSKRGKRFMACDAYPKCENTYPLPQYGSIIPTEEPCKKCAGPQVRIVMSKRKPITVCLDINCKANKDRLKKAKKPYAKQAKAPTASKRAASKPAAKKSASSDTSGEKPASSSQNVEKPAEK
jgi:DNA topoisomerase-1